MNFLTGKEMQCERFLTLFYLHYLIQKDLRVTSISFGSLFSIENSSEILYLPFMRMRF